MDEPSDEILSQIMKEAAEDARIKGEEAQNRYFEQYLNDAKVALAEFKSKYPAYAK